MTNIDSTPATATHIEDFSEFLSDIMSKIWDLHAIANGAEALIVTSDWENSKELRSAASLISTLQASLEATANTLDEGGISYRAQLEKMKTNP